MIDLFDPSALPKESLSEGPETWGEAFSNVLIGADDAYSAVESTAADRNLLDTIYEDRIEKIESLTGTRLSNPIRTAPLERRTLYSRTGMPILFSLPRDAYEDTEAAFDERTRMLAEEHPQVNAIIAESVTDEKNRRMREAEANAAKAAQSPELGTVGRFTAQLVGGLAGAAKDPFQWQVVGIGGAPSTAKTVAGRIGQTMLSEFLINSGVEAILQAASQERKRQAGLEHGLGDALANVGVAGVFGSLFGGTVEGGAELARIFKLGEGGAERAARVIEGRPEPGDVEAVASAMNVELGPEKLDLLNRSFEERVLDDVMVPADGDAAQLRVFEAAKRYAEDPDNNPPPELIERLVADEEAARTRFSPDDYERMFAGDQNAIDDIADTFMADTIDGAARRIDAVADRVDAIAEQVDQAGARAVAGSRADVADAEGVIIERAPEATASAAPVRQAEGPARPSAREPVAGDQRAPANTRASVDPIQGQTIRPREASEPLDDAAEQIADVQAGEIVEPIRDANGNPENYLDFVGVEDGDGNVKIMSTAEALAMADEPEFFADLLEACKL